VKPIQISISSETTMRVSAGGLRVMAGGHLAIRLIDDPSWARGRG